MRHGPGILYKAQASGNPHTGVKWSLQGHSGHEGPSAGGPWAPLRHPPLREKGGGVLQVGVWGHHTDPALECSSEQEGGPGGVSAHPVCSALNKLWEIVKDSWAWHATVHDVAKSQIQLSN